MKPTQIKNFLNNNYYQLVKEYCIYQTKSFTESLYLKKYGRYEKIVELPEDFKEYIENEVKNNFEKDYKILYSKIIKYSLNDNTKPQFKTGYDQIDFDLKCIINISSTLSWPIGINEYLFKNEDNSAIFFQGHKSTRQRALWKSENKEDYVLVLLIQFVNSNSRFLTISPKIRSRFFEVYPD